MGQHAVQAAKAAGYRNAGTIEYVLDKEGNYYFIEMNTQNSGRASHYRNDYRN